MKLIVGVLTLLATYCSQPAATQKVDDTVGLLRRNQENQQTQAGVAQKAEVTVRLLSAHSGKPFKNRHVEIFGTNSRRGLVAENIIFDLHAQTGADGVAHFQLNTPFPTRFLFYSAQAGLCMSSSSLSPRGVEETGIVVPNACAGKDQKYDWRVVTAHPGEITIFAIDPRGPW